MLDRLPVELVEYIVAKLPDVDLMAVSKVDRVWWQEVRQGAYKRWKKYTCWIEEVHKEIQAVREQEERGEIEWLEAEYAVEDLINYKDVHTENQLNIMEKMLKNGMIVDPQERETIEHALSESRWGCNPWRLN